MKNEFTFSELIGSIARLHNELAAQASRAVNTSLTIRNWLIGLYIVNYELEGADRARYGDKLLSILSAELTEKAISNCNYRQLYRYTRFYRFYPEIVGTLSPQLCELLPTNIKSAAVEIPSKKLQVEKNTVFYLLSYSHFDLLVAEEIKKK